MKQKHKFVKVVLSESTADATKDCLKILKGVFVAVGDRGLEADGIQKLIDKLGHKQDQDGSAICMWD